MPNSSPRQFKQITQVEINSKKGTAIHLGLTNCHNKEKKIPSVACSHCSGSGTRAGERQASPLRPHLKSLDLFDRRKTKSYHQALEPSFARVIIANTWCLCKVISLSARQRERREKRDRRIQKYFLKSGLVQSLNKNKNTVQRV